MHDGTEATAKGARRKPARPERDGAEAREVSVSAKTLMGRLERQSGELAVVKGKLEETARELEERREETRLLRQAFEDERDARERLQVQLTRERSARADSDRSAAEAHVTSSALEGQLHLLGAKLKALEQATSRRAFGLRRRR